MRFDDIKSETLNLRVSPSFKQALKAAADHEQRSMVNMLEALVARYCESNQISIPTTPENKALADCEGTSRAAI